MLVRLFNTLNFYDLRVLSIFSKKGAYNHFNVTVRLGSTLSRAQKIQSQYDDLFDFVEFDKCGATNITDQLLEAMRLQWAFGFPNVPAGMSRLTHGFHHYPATMQASTAKHLLETVLPGDSVADLFVGGGTVLIEGVRAGRRTYGADISPLALFIAQGRLWMPSFATLHTFKLIVEEMIANIREDSAKSNLRHWDALKRAVQQTANDNSELALPLWFVYSAALEQGVKARHRNEKFAIAKFYKECAMAYSGRVQELIETIDSLGTTRPQTIPELHRCDACQFLTSKPVSSILTSPPYPGVYNYLSHARSMRVKLGIIESKNLIHDFTDTYVPLDRSWPSDWLNDEIGAFKTLKKNPEEFKSSWQSSHTRWIAQACESLMPGGRLAIQIGDGGGINGLNSTLEGSKQASERGYCSAPLEFMGSVTLRSGPDSPYRMRTEHLVLFERKPSIL